MPKLRLSKTKKIVRVRTEKGIVDVTDDHSLLLSNGKEIKPSSINIEKKTYLLHNACPHINNSQTTYENIYNLKTYENIYNLKTESIIEATNYVNYLNSINYNDYVLNYNDLNYTVSVNIKSNMNNKLQSIKEINYEGYVYDLTTSNHHFAAGIGNLIVHNTDSVFCCFRFRTCCDKVDDETSFDLFKKIINFSKELIMPLMVQEESEEFDKIFKV